MTMFFDGSFWLYFFYFLIVIVIAFFPPGEIFLKKLRLSLLHRFVLGSIVGMVLWGWQGFIFGYLNVRFLTYFYLIFFAALWILFNKKNVSTFAFKIKNIDFFSLMYFPFWSHYSIKCCMVRRSIY